MMSTTSELQPTGRSKVDIVEALAVVLVVVATFASALVSNEPLPGWDSDPRLQPYTPTAFGPGAVGVGSAIQLLGAGVLLGCGAWRGAVRPLLSVVTVAAATGPLLHAFVFNAGDAEQVRLALSWTGALAAGGAVASVVSRERAWSGLLVSAVVGLTVLIAAKGALQILVEHPSTVASYEANKESFLAARGWAPDSANAMQFERRLRQPEPTGWFGLANVFATFVAAGFVASLGWAMQAITARRRTGEGLPEWQTVLLLGVAVGLGIMLVLTGSKGGLAVAGLGVTFLFGLWVLGATGLSRWAVPVGAAVAVLVPLGAVVIRGQLGEDLSELSLLFRWMYLQGAVDVAGQGWPWGVGPAGFRDVYAQVKPVLSAEDVASPHSVLFDFVATMGVFGIASGLALLWISGSPRSTGAAEVRPTGLFAAPRAGLVVLVIVLGLPSLIGSTVEDAGVTIEAALVRLVSLGLAVALGVVVCQGLSKARLSVVPVIAAAMVVLAHAQIEMSLVRPESIGPGLLLVAASWAWSDAPARKKTAALGWVAGAGLAAASVAVAVGPGQSLLEFGRQLRSRAIAESDFGDDFRAMRAAQMEGNVTPDQALALIERDLDAHAVTVATLTDLIVRFPNDTRLHRLRVERSVLTLQALRALGREDDAFAEAFAVLTYAEEAPERNPDSANAWTILGQGRFAVLGVPDAEVYPSDVASAWERAAELDPLDPLRRARLAQLTYDYQDLAAARGHAEAAIELSENRRLDPLTQLPEDLERAMRAILAEAPKSAEEP